MPTHDLVELFVQPLNRIKVRYLISGSVAAMLYGEPRMTHDIDFVVYLPFEDIGKLLDAYPASEFYVPPSEVIAIELSRELNGHFNIIHPASGLKADFYTTNRDELHAWAFRRPQVYSIDGMAVTLAPVEYVIIRKLEYHRAGGSDKHLRDIRSMLAVSGQQLDTVSLRTWIEKRHLETEWQSLTSHPFV